MTFREKLAASLGEELMTKVDEKLPDDFSWDVIPKSRFNTVLRSRNDYRDKLQNLQSGNNDDDDEDDIDEGLKGSSKSKSNKSKNKTSGKDDDSTSDIETLQLQHQKDMDNLTKRFAVLENLRNDKARNPEMVLKNLDLDKITKDDKGQWQGYSEQIEALKKGDAYLFDAADRGTGKNGNSGNGDDGDTSTLKQTDSIFDSYIPGSALEIPEK